VPVIVLVKDMTWEEKEKVLQLLFDKMNHPDKHRLSSVPYNTK